MTVLFRRRAKLIVDTLEITGLRIAFQVQKSLKREPNTAEVRVYNLSDAHRAQLQELSAVRCRIEAGYAPPQLSRDTEEALQAIGLQDEGNLPVIFRGDLREVWSSRDGADWVTTLRSGDGEKGQKNARVQLSFRPGLRWRQVLRKLAEASGVDIGNAIDVIEGTGQVQLATGATVSGSAPDELSKLVESFGMEWSVQDGELQLLERNKALSASAVVLSPDTGLVGSPEPGNEGVVRFRSLMQGELFPGRKVELRSRHITGVHRVERAVYTGDTHGTDWYVEGEAKAL